MPSELGGGPDGAVWFSDQQSANALGRLTPEGTVTEFSTGLQTNAAVDAVVGGPDGKVWFDDQYSTHPAVGSITPSGQITEFPTPSDPGSIVFGVDGNLWATEYEPRAFSASPPAGTMTTFSAGLDPGTDFNDSELIVGPDGNLWFEDRGTPKAIGQIAVQAAPSAQTGVATLTATGATLQGTVNPLGAATTVRFEYGTTQRSRLQRGRRPLTASGDPSPVSAAVTGLPAGTTIYYRASATNNYGTTPGAIRSFATPAVIPITTPGPGRARPTQAHDDHGQGRRSARLAWHPFGGGLHSPDGAAVGHPVGGAHRALDPDQAAVRRARRSPSTAACATGTPAGSRAGGAR